MARDRATTIAALLAGAALIALGIYLNRGGGKTDGDSAGGPSASESDGTASRGSGSPIGPRRPASKDAPAAKISVSPETVELGRVSTCGARETFEVALRNESDKPVRVDAWVSTCACVSPTVAPGFTIEPREVFTLPVAVEPWNTGQQSHRIDFRLSGDGLAPNAAGGRVRVNFIVEGPLRARPAVVTRPDGKRNFAVNIDRVTPEGEFLPEPYEVLGVLPRVAQVLPPLENGHGAINIDFQAIDELAAEQGADANPAFEWTSISGGRRWKSVELTVETSLEQCPQIRVRVRNSSR